MGRPAKVLLIPLALLVVLPALAWVGTFLYWHITIKTEIAAIESQPQPSGVGATFTVLSGGCRTLPYLIDVLESSRHELMIHSAIIQITSQVGDSGRPTEREEWAEVIELFKEFPFRAQDTPEARRANYRPILAWWKSNHTKYHQWWRVWSSKCGS